MIAWHECTDEEIKRVRDGIKNNIDASLGVHFLEFKSSFDDDDDIWDEEYEIEEHEVKEETIDEIFRENFQETWIFETIKFSGSNETSKDFLVPDSMTSWEISAFSTSPLRGLAIMPTQELIVKNDFFVEFHLPYSVRFKEILRLDILVHNYIDEELNVNVELMKNNQFQLIEYLDGIQSCLPITGSAWNKQVALQSMDIKKIFFYIRATKEDNRENHSNNTIIQVKATAKSNKNCELFSDTLKKELLVEPVGIRKYDIHTKNFHLDEDSKDSRVHVLNLKNFSSRQNAIVSGNYLSDLVNLDDSLR